jgi:4,5-DOPA dioxygenase extradiol
MSGRMPVVFIGHGNPMHALNDNAYTRVLARLGSEIEEPEAILCISAHWMTEGTWATHMPEPKTIHDFYGFPRALSEVRYPAPGSPKLAELVRETRERTCRWCSSASTSNSPAHIIWTWVDDSSRCAIRGS